MESLSIIIPAHNNAPVVQRTLKSVEDAIDFFRSQGHEFLDVDAEIVVVDDGSTDGTWDVVRSFASGKGFYRLVRRSEASSPAGARNAGVARSSGDLIFFLDGDDIYFPRHIYECYRILQDKKWSFVKTRMYMADPVHPAWKQRIEACSPINLCLRRECHFWIGGFPDYHIFVRNNDQFQHVTDVFYHNSEDCHYNNMLGSLFTGCFISSETVEYIRYPGNGYDRQYERFCRPPGDYNEPVSQDTRYRFELGSMIIQNKLASLRQHGTS
jgi:glycosyltransferase involved in cell wall biosynthesis